MALWRVWIFAVCFLLVADCVDGKNVFAFNPPENLSLPNTDSTGFPRIVSSGLRVYAVWEEGRSWIDRSCGPCAVFFRRSDDGGLTWSPPAGSLALALSQGLSNSFWPEIAAIGNTIVVIWVNAGTRFDLLYSRSTDGGVNFDPPETLVSGLSSIGFLRIVASASSFHIVWETTDSSTFPYSERVWYSRSIDLGDSFSEPQLLSDESAVTQDSMPHFEAEGSMVAVSWQDGPSDAPIAMRISHDDGASFGTPVVFDKPVGTFPRIAISDGVIHLAWYGASSGGGYDIFYCTSQDGGATFGDVQNISGEGNLVNAFFLLVRGVHVYFVWPDSRGLMFRSSHDGGVSFGDDAILNEHDDVPGSSVPMIAAENNRVAVIWHGAKSQTLGAIYFRESSDLGTTWDPPLDQPSLRVSGNLRDFSIPALSLSGGNTYAVWAEVVNTNYDILFAGTASDTPTHPETPVVLVHGFLGSPQAFGRMKEFLVDDAGYRLEDIYEYDYNVLTSCSADERATIELIAADFAAYIKAKLNQYPSGTKIDVVAHSMGGLVARAYMAGMAQFSGADPIPYGGEIRRLIMAGTPNYGAAGEKGESFLHLLELAKCKALEGFEPGGLKEQVKEAKYGSRFLWDLDRRWLERKLLFSQNIVVIAGTANDLDDGIVRVASAVLPVNFSLPSSNILYVPYKHCNTNVCGDSSKQALVDVQGVDHMTFKIVKQFLSSGQPPTQIELGYQPSEVTLDSSLLLVHTVDKLTQLPIVKPPSLTIKCPSRSTKSIYDSQVRNTDDDAGSITLPRINTVLWSCTIEIKKTGKYPSVVLNDLDLSPGLPNVYLVEVVPKK